MNTLLVSASRVSKNWHNYIQQSPALQVALFLKPMPSKQYEYRLDIRNTLPQSERQDGGTKEPVLNPLLVRNFGDLFFPLEGTCDKARRATYFAKLPWSEQTKKSFTDGRSCQKPKSRNSFMRCDASWRRMLVSQPPPPYLGYMFAEDQPQVQTEQQYGQSASTALVSPLNTAVGSLGGLQMGQLYDIIQYNAGHHKYHSLWFRVIWNQPKGPFVTQHYHRICRQLLTHTCLVVELYDIEDSAWANHPTAPADISAFDAEFQSDDFQLHEIVTETATASRFQFPACLGSAQTWDWDII